IDGNSALNLGAGILNDAGSKIDLTNTSVSGNTTQNAGGGIFNNATVTLVGSSINENTALGLGRGGGIYNARDAIVYAHDSGNAIDENVAGVGAGVMNDGAVEF